MHLLDVVDHCRPPAGNALAVARRRRGRSGVHEQRAAAHLEHVEERCDALISRGVDERGRRQAEADESQLQVAGEEHRIDGREARGRPRAERRRQRERAFVIGGEQLGTLVCGEPFDAEGARQRHDGKVDVVALRLGGAEIRIVVLRPRRSNPVRRRVRAPIRAAGAGACGRAAPRGTVPARGADERRLSRVCEPVHEPFQ